MINLAFRFAIAERDVAIETNFGAESATLAYHSFIHHTGIP